MLNNKVFRLKDVIRILGISRSMLYLWMDEQSKYFNPDFPRPIKLSIRSIGWKSEDIEAFINSRIYQKRDKNE